MSVSQVESLPALTPTPTAVSPMKAIAPTATTTTTGTAWSRLVGSKAAPITSAATFNKNVKPSTSTSTANKNASTTTSKSSSTDDTSTPHTTPSTTTTPQKTQNPTNGFVSTPNSIHPLTSSTSGGKPANISSSKIKHPPAESVAEIDEVAKKLTFKRNHPIPTPALQMNGIHPTTHCHSSEKNEPGDNGNDKTSLGDASGNSGGVVNRAAAAADNPSTSEGKLLRHAGSTNSIASTPPTSTVSSSSPLSSSTDISAIQAKPTASNTHNSVKSSNNNSSASPSRSPSIPAKTLTPSPASISAAAANHTTTSTQSPSPIRSAWSSSSTLLNKLGVTSASSAANANGSMNKTSPSLSSAASFSSISDNNKKVNGTNTSPKPKRGGKNRKQSQYQPHQQHQQQQLSASTPPSGAATPIDQHAINHAHEADTFKNQNHKNNNTKKASPLPSTNTPLLGSPTLVSSMKSLSIDVNENGSNESDLQIRMHENEDGSDVNDSESGITNKVNLSGGTISDMMGMGMDKHMAKSDARSSTASTAGLSDTHTNSTTSSTSSLSGSETASKQSSRKSSPLLSSATHQHLSALTLPSPSHPLNDHRSQSSDAIAASDAIVRKYNQAHNVMNRRDGVVSSNDNNFHPPKTSASSPALGAAASNGSTMNRTPRANKKGNRSGNARGNGNSIGNVNGNPSPRNPHTQQYYDGNAVLRQSSNNSRFQSARGGINQRSNNKQMHPFNNNNNHARQGIQHITSMPNTAPYSIQLPLATNGNGYGNGNVNVPIPAQYIILPDGHTAIYATSPPQHIQAPMFQFPIYPQPIQHMQQQQMYTHTHPPSDPNQLPILHIQPNTPPTTTPPHHNLPIPYSFPQYPIPTHLIQTPQNVASFQQMQMPMPMPTPLQQHMVSPHIQQQQQQQQQQQFIPSVHQAAATHQFMNQQVPPTSSLIMIPQQHLPSNINTSSPAALLQPQQAQHMNHVESHSPPLPDPRHLNQEGRDLSILRQLEYYFSVDNLVKDMYLRKQMDSDGYVSIDKLLSFRRMQALTTSRDEVERIAHTSHSLEVNNGNIRSRHEWFRFTLPTIQTQTTQIDAATAVETEK